jgi:hypothetical protein|tara:strand:+ start:762 stop:1031 length:270 start_codon:yes stop_codon:yes gene_type:complete
MSGLKGRSGRKPQNTDLEMIKRLTVLDDQAFEELKKGIERGEFAFLKLYFHMRFGRPKQMQDITINSEQPLFDLSLMPEILFKKTDNHG